jgi:hypothetical protein
MSDDSGVPTTGMLGRLGPGSRVAGYVIEEKVGSGGMAVVFRARDEALGRLIALKVLAPALADDEEFRIRFLRESRSVAAVEEPHIVPVYAAGEADGVLYLATRFVAGGDLAALLRRAGGTLDPARAAALITQVASALDAAHAVGLVHRDVKPGNVLIDDAPGRSEHAYLSDFGLSKAVSSATGLTASGVFLGTPDYCSPEQIMGRPPVSAQSDEYSLACVAFHVLTGTVPYRRGETLATLFAHLHDPVPSLTAIRPDLPGAVDSVLATALAKESGDRYASCGEFALALRAAVQSAGLPSTTAPPAVPPVVPPDADARAPETIADTHAADVPAPGPALAGALRDIAGTAPDKPAHRRRVVITAAVAAAILVAGGTWAGLTLPGSREPAAAAVVGNQRITEAMLDSQVSNLETAAKPYRGTLQLTTKEMPTAVLTWLIRFDIMNRVAANAGFTVSHADIQAGLANINSQAAIAASQLRFSVQEVLLGAGIPPQLNDALGQYRAQETAYTLKINNGNEPSTTAEENTVNKALDKAECEAAKELDIQVSPEFGRFDYSQYAVVAATPSPTSTEGLVPAC